MNTEKNNTAILESEEGVIYNELASLIDLIDSVEQESRQHHAAVKITSSHPMAKPSRLLTDRSKHEVCTAQAIILLLRSSKHNGYDIARTIVDLLKNNSLRSK